MSVRYTIDNLKTMREAAGLGVLSMGVCAISGELVSSTPIPGSRCGHAGQDTADYGGYLLGEGMTPAAALYLANLHNHFPALAVAAEKVVDEWDQDAVDYLRRVSGIARRYGWGPADGSLADWIEQSLITLDERRKQDGRAAVPEPLEPISAGWLADKIGGLGDYGQGAARKLRQQEHQVAEMEAALANLTRERDLEVADVIRQDLANIQQFREDVAKVREEATLAERERIIDLLAVNTSFPVVVCEFDKHAEEMVGDILSHEDLRAALAVKP